MPNLDEVTFMKEIWKKNFKIIKKSFLKMREDKVKQNFYAEFFAKHAMNMYQNEDYKSTKNMYFLCLLSVEYGTALHGLILSNLSSVDYLLKDYENCIKNIDMCMTTQYAKTSLPKLYVRKIKALIHLNDKIKANHVFEECLSFLNAHIQSKVQRDILIEEAKKALTNTKPKKYQICIDPDKLIIPDFERGHTLTCKAKCAFSENMGTYIDAYEVIKKGETILVETFENVLHIKVEPSTTLYCITCVKKLEVLIPCENCGDVMYCSESCKAKHSREGHKYECALFSSGFARGFSPCLILAYRMLLKYITTNEICSKRWLDLSNECFFDTKDESNNTLAINCCSLIMYMEENAAFMKEIEMFELFQAASKDIKFLFAANLFKLAEFISRNRIINNNEENIYGFFPICSLFNHSCIPNTTHYMSDCTIIIKAGRDIAKGEQIFISYEGLLLTYWNCSTDHRKLQLLEVYRFNCTCEACENDIFNKDPTTAFLCKKCNSDNARRIKNTNNVQCTSCNYLDDEVVSNFLQLINSTKESEVTNNKYKSSLSAFQIIKFNTNHILYFDMCRLIALIALKAGKLEEALKYIEIIQNMKLFYLFHNELDAFVDHLQNCLSSLLTSKESQVFQVNRHFLVKLKKLLEDLHMSVDLLCPTQRRFEKLDAVKRFYKIFEDIWTLDETINSCKWKSRNVNLY